MIYKTHIAIGVMLAFLFFPYVTNKWVFVPIVLFASLMPDIDSAYSYLGHKRIFRPLQFFVQHRGVIHSFTFCLLVSAIFAFFIPILALPFFLGYAGHLFADSLTIEGIRPFWPLHGESAGSIRVGGKVESSIFFFLIIIDLALLIYLII